MTYAASKARAEHMRAEARLMRDPDYAAQREREQRAEQVAALVARCAANLPFADQDDGTLTVALESDASMEQPADNWWFQAGSLVAALGTGSMLRRVNGKLYRVTCEEIPNG